MSVDVVQVYSLSLACALGVKFKRKILKKVGSNITLLTLIILFVGFQFWQFLGYDPLDSFIDQWVDQNLYLFYLVVVSAGIYSLWDMFKQRKTMALSDAIQYFIICVSLVVFSYLASKELGFGDYLMEVIDYYQKQT